LGAVGSPFGQIVETKLLVLPQFGDCLVGIRGLAASQQGFTDSSQQ
jgi:hypothetical protein